MVSTPATLPSATSRRSSSAPSDAASTNASDAPAPSTTTPDAATTTPARATPSVATQTGARMRASSAGTSLQAQLNAKLDATPNASASATAEPTYEEKLAAYNVAHDAWQQKSDDYWSNMKATRKTGGYVTDQPPVYDGPKKPVDPNAPEAPPRPSTIPKKQTFVDAAQSEYGFVPDEADEQTQKQAYAKEAKQQGFDANTVARVYAFETGGNGKADDQPIRKDGTAISTALGYTQVLNATTVELMQKHGDEFASQLDAAGKHDKADVVRRMTADAQSAGTKDEEYAAFAKTPKGRAMHAALLDVDIGSKMQAQNLKDITDNAAKLGLKDMTPAQLELLNLAGEGNGAKMLRPELRDLPTANFFTRAGYEANPVVMNRTGAQLLQKIDDTMTTLMQKQGSQDLLAAFSAV